MPVSHRIIFAVTGLTVVIILIASLAAIPTSAVNGGKTITLCNLNLNVTGTYNDNGVSHSITNFNFQAGAMDCHTQTLLDFIPGSSLQSIVPPAQANLFGLTITFEVSLTSTNGGTTHGPYPVQASIPPLNYEYNFAGTYTISCGCVQSGSYSVVVTSSVPFSGGATSYQTTVSF